MLRDLHMPGAPVVLANAWDAASARSVAAAGFPVVGTTSAGVAASIGHEDHHRAPAGEMLAAAGRICASVPVPVTVDAEAGYGLEPSELVEALESAGAAGCNLEDTDHATGSLRDADEQAEWLAAVRAAAWERNYGLVINARVDVFLPKASMPGQLGLVDEAVERARAYLGAGADCVYPIALWEPEALGAFVGRVPGPVTLRGILGASG
jgi:2-methylisocitrate lyase-like PEP mutase family enzyme